jgi:hypothetical protein
VNAVTEKDHAHSIPKIGGSSFLEGIGDGLLHETSEKATVLRCHSYNDKNWGRIHRIREYDGKN